MHKPRILIADDHALVAEGLRGLLAETYDIVGISANGRRLLADAAALKPDIIVLDIGMPELNGIDAAVQLSKLVPEAKLVFVTQQIDAQYLRAAFRAGGTAYVAKQSASHELLAAIKCALAGEIYVTPLLKNALPNLSLNDLRQGSDIFARDLTQRQREVLQLIAEGKTVKEISAALQISPKT
ncbi:MAG TPA: response regulator transcription factor, partial [Terracidiphilus sp.]